MVIEYVADRAELVSLSRGQVRYVIETEPIYYTDMGGKKPIQSGEVRLIVNITALSKAKDPQRVISLKLDMGTSWYIHPNTHRENLLKIHQAIREDWPDIKEGKFE